MDIPQEVIDAADAVAPEVLLIPGVTGVGLGFREEDGELVDELTVRVLVADAGDVPAGIPESLAGLPVAIIEFPVEPLFAPDVTRYDDLPGGAQIEPVRGASGTLGAIVQDGTGTEVGLTCHHVSGDPGSTLWQPEAPLFIAGGPPPDLTNALGETIAVASPATQTIPVPSGAGLLLGRQLDAATVSLGEAVDQGRTLNHAITDGFGVIDSTMPPSTGMFVRKRGSQSGPTAGIVVGIQLVVPWDAEPRTPPPGHRFVMSHQYEIFFLPPGCPDGIFARGGDSGSLVLENDNRTAVGLLWAGNRAGGTRALMSDITVVESELGIKVAWP
ncbi:hypothetical protein J2Z21_009049 [Streptomyces griseochromogenes]|uniref:Uncharacterized protein n=1 Tax=Streptomyces griseochromogenes TaxID=68214 RepID=A0A1B1AYE1_9ACTN|nr:hypothetical protein [Streptomyces griseochromogenes]ANP51565.1 hypothetical protein AVL59_19910 [Streptomyces griseochromogenes]MBP2056032.1 hypothetical protein [Streptomyces griseochromogenes]